VAVTSRGRSKYGKILGALGGAAVLLTLTSPPRLAPSGTGASLTAALTATATPASTAVGPVTQVSHCPGQNAEVETATGKPDYVYDLWIGCGGIGFARSTDGGLHFGKSMTVPGSAGFSWDPAITVGSTGAVYVSFMHQAHRQMYPVVDASFDFGVSFPQVSSLRPPKARNWGDRDFIAVNNKGWVYVTWDFGPSAALVKLLCSKSGSCAYKAGDLNAVIQRSVDGGKTWGPIIPLGPNFPRNGGYSAPVLVQHTSQVDVLAWGHHVSKPPSYALHPGHEFFSSSADGGANWPKNPVEVDPSAGSIALPTWWIDGDLSHDQGGNLYATWDTQTPAGDIGWLSFSTDNGKTWSPQVRVTPDNDKAVHIVESAGGPVGIAYVAWQTDAPAAGYATYLRPYSVSKGWLGPRIQVSNAFGNRKIWPGDTFGMAPLPASHGARLALSWGSATGQHKDSEIYAATVSLPAAAAAAPAAVPCHHMR
jgi:BNR/Asp-box repeat